MQTGITLDDLKESSCRYIIGDLYCGARKVKGAYCGPHAKLCYVASKPRGEPTAVLLPRLRVSV